MHALALLLLCVAPPLDRAIDPLDAAPATDNTPAADDEHRFLPVVIPAISASSDEGFGGGAVFALHHFYGGVKPLRDDLSVKIFLTSRWVQRHELRWEGLRVFDLPLRAWVRFGLFSTVTQNFCGFGMGVACSDDVARAAARASGLTEGEAFDDFVRHYHQVQTWRPHADTVVRWQLTHMPHRLELFAGWRAAHFFSGSLLEEGPYPGSLYAKVFPRGEVGWTSVPEVGFTLDDRDDEVAPSRGYFLEASLRGADPLWGSTWSWGAVNASVHGYDTVLEAPHMVYAARFLVDLGVGDMPTDEMGEVGGIKDQSAFGGAWIGRGVRDRRYLGKLKAIHQSEVRTDLARFEVWGTGVGVAASAFADVGWVGYDINDVTASFGKDLWRTGSPLALVYGGGVGLRIILNDAIVARVEMNGSPLEQRTPSFYTPVGNSL